MSLHFQTMTREARRIKLRENNASLLASASSVAELFFLLYARRARSLATCILLRCSRKSEPFGRSYTECILPPVVPTPFLTVENFSGRATHALPMIKGTWKFLDKECRPEAEPLDTESGNKRSGNTDAR
jgi:hypothetical protein